MTYDQVGTRRDPEDMSLPLRGASFGDAVRRYGKGYFQYSGRASKSEYWWPMLAAALVILVILAVVAVAGALGADGDGTPLVGVGGVVVFAVVIVYAIGAIALTMRRLHDIDRSGWWVLAIFVAGFIPVLNIVASVAGIAIGLIDAEPAGARFDAQS
ncbi:DUF805 domain-containing protein [Tsukamurella sp. USMM236]|uniref:DUF805 domain-containing protein n=1 Tax=Tsukamurella sp. USMM236 TaxID=3081301 RepID=UPI00301A5455